MRQKIIRFFTFFKSIPVIRLQVLFVSITLLLQCTAFFNTYYNGKIAFNEANKAHQKLLRNFPDSIIVTPTAEIVKLYDRSIEKANKVTEVYSKAPRWQDDALLLMGKSYYFKRENDRCIRMLSQLLQEQPKSKLIPEAYFYIGKSYIDLGEFDKAEHAFGVILEKYPRFSQIEQVDFLLVHIAIERGGRSQAISLLEKARKKAHSAEFRAKTLLMIVELYIDLKQYDRALTLLDGAPRRGIGNHEAFRFDKAKFTCYSESGKNDKALAQVNKMFGDPRYEVFRPNLLLMKALILMQLGRVDDAVAVYKKIVDGVDSTKISGDTSSVTGRAFYELALIHQKYKSDYKNASMYSHLAAKSKDTTVAVKAGLLSSAFEKLEKLRNEKDSSEIAKQKRLFRIGELFRFELSEPDSAFNQFIQISSGSSDSIVPVSLCAAAYIARDALKDTAKADSLFKVIIQKFPVSEYAQRSQMEMHLVVTVKTRRDSAYDAFRVAEETLYGSDQDVKSAINKFYDVYRNYPEIDIAPKSLFVAAWLIDDQLQKNKTAKELYEKICEKYPDSYYCRSEAKPRLEEVTKAMKSPTSEQAVQEAPAKIQEKTDGVPDSLDLQRKMRYLPAVENTDSSQAPHR